MLQFFILCLLLLLTGISENCQIQNEEYAHKANCIFYFTKFIKWDSSHQLREFYVGVMGPSAIIDQLEAISKKQTVNGKKIVVKKFKTPAEISYCHILFIPKSSFPLDVILLYTPDKGTLIVSEESGFASKGAGINFYPLNHKVKFEVNLKALESAGLKASSQLLKLAWLVEPCCPENKLQPGEKIKSEGTGSN